MSDQLKLFDSKPKPTGWDLAKRDMNRVADNAELNEPGWRAGAARCLDKYAAKYPGGEFTCEDVRVWAESLGFPKAHDSRAWGQIMRHAGKKSNPQRIITKVGTSNYKKANCHRGLNTLWQSLY